MVDATYALTITAPTLNTVSRLVAKLGGFLARKGDGEPGMKTLWLSLERVRDFADGLQFFQTPSRGEPVCV